MAALKSRKEAHPGWRWGVAGRLVGMLFGVVWAAAATSHWPQPAHTIAWATIALIVAVLATHVFRQGAQPGMEKPSPQQRRRGTRGFLLLLVAEVLAMNLAAMLLDRYHGLDYLMPAVAIIVGLHFLPMAPMLRLPVYRGAGLLMVACGIAAAAALATGVAVAPVLQAMELACALTLWGAVSQRSRHAG